jgi:signal transduction histidine kinase
MRLSIKTKQVAGVTLIVGLVALALSGWYLSSLMRVQLEESRTKAHLIADFISQGAFAAVAAGADPYSLQEDAGLRSILDASLLANGVLYAAIVDTDRRVIAHYDAGTVGEILPPTSDDLDALVDAGPVEQAKTLFGGGLPTYEVRTPLLLGDLGDTGSMKEFGSVVVGLSSVFIRSDVVEVMQPLLYTVMAALIVAVIVAMVLAQVVLRPIHVIRSGLARLGRGELDVDVELPNDEALGDMGDSLKAISARLAADRTQLAGQRATLESVVEHLEDAVALFSPDGTLLFANAAMSQTLGGATGSLRDLLPDAHPYRKAVESALAGGHATGPQTVLVPDAGERLLITDRIGEQGQAPVGVLLVARNLAYLSQVESTLSYSRKLAALGRLSSGIAHEVKNPLNATMIHLELLRSRLQQNPDALEHVAVITTQMRRLDEVVQGFLKFTRPEDLRLKPVSLSTIVDCILPIVLAEAGSHRIDVRVDCPADLPHVSADPGLLEQAFLNLALNACQAMPDGGQLRIVARPQAGGVVQIAFEDTGVGIPPEALDRVFDLYYTTKSEGSGIGLSLVYRTIQLHDGEIEVQSVPGRGTTFRILLRQAGEKPATAAARAS